MHASKILSVILLSLILSACSWFKDKDTVDLNKPARTLYSEAKKELDAGNYENAIKQYEALQARYPYGKYSQQAGLELAYAYYKYDEPASAIATADRFIKLYPTHAYVDYAYYLKGLADFKDQTTFLERIFRSYDFSDRDPSAALDSYEAFSELVERFPDSDYAEDARLRMLFIQESLAAHEIKVAQWYLKIDAFVAVVNRARYVLDNYPRTPSVEDALGLLATTYPRMGMAELGEDNLRVLKLNFPQSRYIKSAEKALAAASKAADA
jgi:outer membrane protein assembly factor BamD